MEKRFDVGVAGVLCADLRHPNHQKAEEVINKIQPNTSYNSVGNLIPINRRIPDSAMAEWEKFVEEAVLHDGGFCLGGIVPNSGIPLSYLLGEKRVALMANVGKGLVGKLIKEQFEKHTKTPLFLEEVDEDSSYSVILKKDGRWVACHSEGSNATFGTDNDFTPLYKSRFALLGYPPLLKKFRDGKALRDVVRGLKREGTRVYMDMSAIVPGTPTADANWNEVLSLSLPYVEGFVPSLNEAVHIFFPEFSGIAEKIAKRKNRGILDVMTELDPEILRQTAEHFLKMGVERVILTCGIEGAYVRTRESADYNWKNRDLFVNATREKRKIDTIGAGDNAKAVIVYSVLKNYHPFEATLAGVAAGALNVENKGSFGAFKSFVKIREAMERGPVPFNPGRYFRKSGNGFYIGSRDRMPVR